MTNQPTAIKESGARKVVDEILNHLGWVTDEFSPECSVFTERPKTKAQQDLLGGKCPDYVLYEPSTDRSIAIIEAKKPGQTLSDAIQDSIEKYAIPLGIDIIFATDGKLFESFDRRSGSSLSLDGEPIVELISPRLLVHFADHGPNVVTPTKSRQSKLDLISIFAQANDLLRKEGLREGVERFTEFSNLLFLKLISEIEADREIKGEPRRLAERYCWNAFASKEALEMLDYINDTILPRLVRSYNHSGDVFQHQLNITNAHVLKEIVDRLSGLSLLDAESDVKGDAFEYFLKHSVTVGNDLGEYFTPRHIVKLMVELVDPAFLETVYDPCCGTGGFLIEAFRHIVRKVKPSKESKLILENKTIFGAELTGTARIAKMNMILAGDGHTHIYQQDSLNNPISDQYDVVLTNFPFSQKTDYSSYYGLDTADGNPVFLKHVIDACAPGGTIGVVVPEGLLFSEASSHVTVRQYMVEHCDIQAVIALHDFVFRPYTDQPTAIVIMTKGKPGGDVWFYNVEEDGFEKTRSKTGRPPSLGKPNHLIDLRSKWSEKPDSERSYTVPINLIRATSYKLSYSSYRPREENTEWLPLGGKDGICEIILGGTPKTSTDEYWNGTHPWATISDMTNRYIKHTDRVITELGVKRSSAKLIPRGTVLVSFKLTIGRVAITARDMYTNEAIAALIPNSQQVLPEYLYHVIPSLDLIEYAQPASKGKTLNKKILEQIRVPVPSIEEQQIFIDHMNELEANSLKLRELANENDKQKDDFVRLLLARQQ